MMTDDNQGFFRSYEKFNAIAFMDYLEAARKKFGKIFVIVDRAPQHKANDVKKYLRKNKDVKLAYLPRGSPHLSMIEEIWRQCNHVNVESEFYESIHEMRCTVMEYFRTHRFNLTYVSVFCKNNKLKRLMIWGIGDKWHADEVWLKIKGDKKYLFAMMDDETRFWIAQEVGDRKEGHNARGLLQKAKQVTGTKPKVFITDSLGSYHEAYKKEFWTLQRRNRTLHIRHIHLQGDMNNNKMERLNGEIRDREKVMRGIKKKDSVTLTGYQLFHNYIRPHSALDGLTPSEKCGMEIKGDNKWITLIQNASEKLPRVKRG